MKRRCSHHGGAAGAENVRFASQPLFRFTSHKISEGERKSEDPGKSGIEAHTPLKRARQSCVPVLEPRPKSMSAAAIASMAKCISGVHRVTAQSDTCGSPTADTCGADDTRGAEYSGCGAEDSGCHAEDNGCGSEDNGCGAEGSGCRAEGCGCRAEDNGCGSEEIPVLCSLMKSPSEGRELDITETEHADVYVMKVHGKQNFELLSSIRDTIEQRYDRPQSSTVDSYLSLSHGSDTRKTRKKTTFAFGSAK